jgi:AAA family ATP:ADP antiporter
MIVLNVPFGSLLKPLPREPFILVSYRFFTVNILIFAAPLQ